MNNPVSWFEIYVADMARAKAFYEAVLKISLSHLPAPMPDPDLKMYAFPMFQEAEGASGALVFHPMRQPHQEGTLIYFSCTDCAIETARVEPAGGKVMQAKISIGEFGFIAMAMDTEGNGIGFHSLQ